MSSYVCIPQSKNDDPNYRYKMPQMMLAQVSRLNGVKTNIKNLPAVASALRVPDSAILKYFCSELGANAEGTSIVKGQHTLEDLQKHLDKFINRYVLCKKCKLPELTHEVNKKNLIGICRSCGNTDSKMDTMHKAGKQLLKEIPNFKPSQNEQMPTGTASSAATGKPDQKGGKKQRKNQAAVAAAAAAEAEAEEAKVTEQANKERAKTLAASGGEINRLNSTKISISDPSISTAVEELRAFVAEKESEGPINCNDIVREVRQQQLQLNVTPEYKLYLSMMGIFGPTRNIAKHWDTFEAVFTELMGQNEEAGCQHLLQCVIQFFINVCPEQQDSAAALCKKLYDNSIVTDELFVQWHGKQAKLDKTCAMYDRAAEKAFRPLIAEFIAWLSSAEYDEEADYGDEGAGEEEKKEEEAPVETEAQRKQRELIEAQKLAMAEQLAAAKAAGAKKRETEAAADQESATADDDSELQSLKATKDVSKIAVEENFDIDDI